MGVLASVVGAAVALEAAGAVVAVGATGVAVGEPVSQAVSSMASTTSKHSAG